MTITYNKKKLAVAVLFYVLGALYFSQGFHFLDMQTFWASEINEKINFAITVACIVEAARTIFIYSFRPTRIKFTAGKITIFGLGRPKVLDLSEKLKVTLCFFEDDDLFGFKRKIKIEAGHGKAINISVIPLYFNAEEFVQTLKSHGVAVIFS